MLERPITSRIALSATAFTVPSGVWMLNRKFAEPVRLDLPEHREIDVDDVLVAGEHQAFFRHVARGRAAADVVDDAHADIDLDQRAMLARCARSRSDKAGDSSGPAARRARYFPKRSTAPSSWESTRKKPEKNQSATAAIPSRMKPRPPILPPGRTIFQLVLAAAQQVFEVGRASTAARLRSRAPRAFRTRTPGPTALIAPRH